MLLRVRFFYRHFVPHGTCKFIIHHSAFIILHSVFCIHHSAFYSAVCILTPDP